MALSPLNWKYVGAASFTGGSISACLDAIYTLGQATTYANGTARTPGTGSAWTWAREQISSVTEAAYGNPPTNALGMRYIVANTTRTQSYTLLSPDNAMTNNCLLYGMNRGSGTYTSWVNAQPFTSGFSGYWKWSRTFSTVSYDRVFMWESQEGCVMQVCQAATAGTTSAVAFGALLDPLSSAAGTAESDGRVYMMTGQGSTSNISAQWSSLGASDGGWFSHTTSVQTCHSGAFNNASTTVTGIGRYFGALGNVIPAAWANRGGEIPRIPVQVGVLAGAFYGQLREIYYTSDSQTGLTWRYLGVEQGYIAGYHPTTAGDSLLLKV